jgi:hypothetical protein
LEGTRSDGNKTQYLQQLFQNGSITKEYFNDVAQIPNYLVIDVASGEVKDYNSINDIPPEQQEFFRKIIVE